MHVLILPSFYPEKSNPINGIFFKKQAEAMTGSIGKVGVVYVEQKSLRKLFSNFLLNRYQFSSIEKNGLIEYRLHGINLLNQYVPGALLWKMCMFSLVKKYIRDHGVPDVIHAHNTFNAGFVAFKIAKKYRIPYIITEHSSGYLMGEYSAKKLIGSNTIVRNAKHLLAVGQKLAGVLNRIYNREAAVVPNIVDTTFFTPDFSKQKKEMFQFISVGNLLSNKGHAFLIEAFATAIKENDKIRLVICGDGPEKKQLESLIEKYKIEGLVLLKGKVDQDCLLNEYRESKCLVLPSENETFGVVLIEALSCGIPVIATTSGGPEDIVNDENGVLVDYGNVNQLARAMIEMSKNDMNFNNDSIRQSIIDKYSNDAIVKTLKFIYAS